MTRLVGFLFLATTAVYGAVVDQEIEIKGNYAFLRTAPGDSGALERFGLTATQLNSAGGDGLLQEGFGIGNFYAPNRRLNEKLEVLDSVADRPVIQYSYDCEGPNTRGLHVTRTMEPFPDEASVRVTWKVENKGEEDQWIAPWVRNEVTAGGAYEKTDRLDIPSVDGILNPDRSEYLPAARNWAAATDPTAKESVYGVFNADQAYAFLALRDDEDRYCGFQTALVPKLLKKGDTWQTIYRLNTVRGLSHVDFATDELAVQLDYHEGKLEALFAVTRKISGLLIQASVKAPNNKVWHLPAKKFDIEPGTVIRCTYPWDSPADGTYEFMARLDQGGKEYMLGKDTASPHGGVDTQFVVGKAKNVSFEPWTDAPFTLNRGKRTLQRAVAVPGPVSLWFESALEKIFPDDQVQAVGTMQPAAHISLAANEHESFQIVVRPPEGKDLSNVTLKVKDLVNDATGEKIPASQISLSTVAYYPVRVPSHFEGPTGLWPDPLPAFEPFTARGGVCSPIWVTVYAPPGTHAGEYAGQLELTSPDLDPVDLFLRVQVYGFQLPATPALKTDFGFESEGAKAWCQSLGYKGKPDALNDAYVDLALSHRVTLRELTQLPAESADYAASLKAYEPKLNKLLEKGASSIAVPPSLLEVPEQLKMADAFVAKHNLKAKAFCQIADEPLRPAWPRLIENMGHWHTTAPNIPLLITTFGTEPLFQETCEIWAAHTPVFDTINNAMLLQEISKGKEVWWYVNHTPPRPYANFFIDFAAIEHRILFWQSWALGIKGMYYWAADYTEPGENPWFSQLDVTPANGDGLLIYPSSAGPASSIRLESIRDGIDDYDYLALFWSRLKALKDKKGDPDLIARAEKVYDLKALVPDLVSYTRDPNVLLAKRDALAKLIVEMGK